MVKKKPAEKATKQVRLYPKEYGVLWRLAHRKHITVAEIIRLLIKGV
jgi:DNA-binding MarR family transcriptional regulator